MPKELPSAAQAWEDVSFFSIDTNLIQAAGYNFAQGALHQLPRQLPLSMGLQLPEVVVNEIVKHRMEPVQQAVSGLKSAADKLSRLFPIDVSGVHGSLESMNVIESATQYFREEVHDYATRCRGGVLPTAGADAVADLFADYFAQMPPFGVSEKKKAEFPDALCLWLLERHAKSNDTAGIVASNDKGWKQYAERSERLYCVGSVEELAALFAATNDHADAIRNRVAVAVEDAASPLRAALTDALERHVGNSEWDASEVYTGSSYRVEPEVYDAELVEYGIAGKPDVWPVQGEPTTWVIELSVSVKAKVHLSAEFFAWDSIDKEEISLNSQDFTTEEEIDIDVFLSCEAVRLDSSPNDWQTDIEIADGRYSLAGFEVELNYGPDE
jgi:PIN domain